MSQKIDYLNPALPAGLRRVSMPVVDATPATLEGFGGLVADPSECPIEIVQWPARGTRPIDPGTGDEAGTTEGTFVSEWRGDILYGRNEAVGGATTSLHTQRRRAPCARVDSSPTAMQMAYFARGGLSSRVDSLSGFDIQRSFVSSSTKINARPLLTTVSGHRLT